MLSNCQSQLWPGSQGSFDHHHLDFAYASLKLTQNSVSWESVLGGVCALEQKKLWETLGLEEQGGKRVIVEISLRYVGMCHTEESVTKQTNKQKG